MNLIIYGAGGQEKVFACSAKKTRHYKNFYFIDPNKDAEQGFISNSENFFFHSERKYLDKDLPSVSIVVVENNLIRRTIVSENE